MFTNDAAINAKNIRFTVSSAAPLLQPDRMRTNIMDGTEGLYK